MRKLIAFTFTLTSFCFSAESVYDVNGMMCGVGCVNKINAQMSTLDGVDTYNVDFEKKMMTVTYDDAKISEADIAAILNEKATYKCTVQKEEKKKRGLLSRLFNMF